MKSLSLAIVVLGYLALIGFLCWLFGSGWPLLLLLLLSVEMN